MGVTAGTVQTYANSLIREDLQQAYSMISPEEVPFTTSAGTSAPPTQTYHEWPIVSLAAPDDDNRVVEGEAAPGVDTATLGLRRGNHTQISDKRVITSHTSEKVDAAAQNVQRMAEQIVLKMKELKRDIETMLLSNVAGSAGTASVARVSAGLPNFLRTNVILGAGGSVATLSGTTEGFPNSTVTPGTAVPFDEDDLNDLLHEVWEAGGTPNFIMVNGNNKRVLSNTFTGNATRYKDAIDKRLTAAIDVYDSDFGEVSVVPNRFQPTLAADTYAVYVLDPEYYSVAWLDTVKQKPLAETGHAKDKLVWGEYTLQVDNEAALGMIAATTGTSGTSS